MQSITSLRAEQAEQPFWMETVLDLDCQNLYVLIQTRKDQEAKTRVFLFLQAVGHDRSRKGQFL